MERTLLPGKPYPLGATPTPKGTNFSVYSQHATSVSVCFFDEAGNQTDCVALRERTAFVWHGLIRNIRPGQRYGFRVEGPWEPENGLRFNSSKLLVDPYAKALTGNVDWKAPIFPYRPRNRRRPYPRRAGLRPRRPQMHRRRSALRLERRLSARDSPR